MKILYLALVELEVYNAPRTHMIEVCENLTKLGHEVLLLAPNPRKKIQRFSFKTMYVPFFGWGALREYIFHILLSIYFFFCIIRFKPEIIYERMLGSPLCLKISRFLGMKHFLEVNGSPFQNSSSRKTKRIRSELAMADKIIVPSPKLKEHILTFEKLNDTKIQFIPNGVNPSFFFPGDKMQARRGLGIPPANFYIVYTGGIYYAYDFGFVVKALDALKDIIKDLSFLAVGAAYESEHDNILLERNVKYEDIPLHINAADLCLLPLSKNGMETQDILGRTKLLEYIACGKKVLAPRPPGENVPDILKKFLIFYEYNNTESFIKEIQNHYNNRKLLDVSLEDIDAFIKEYNWEETAKKILCHIQ